MKGGDNIGCFCLRSDKSFAVLYLTTFGYIKSLFIFIARMENGLIFNVLEIGLGSEFVKLPF